MMIYDVQNDDLNMVIDVQHRMYNKISYEKPDYVNATYNFDKESDRQIHSQN